VQHVSAATHSRVAREAEGRLMLNVRQFAGQPLFHGTTKAAAAAIEREGLRATHDGNYTLTPHREVAEDYSLNGWHPDEGGAVVEVRLPPQVHHAYVEHRLQPGIGDAHMAIEDGEVERDDGSAWLRRDIPARYVRRVR